MSNLENKVDKILEDITEVKVTQAEHGVYLQANTKSLDEHMLRTSLNEKRIKRLEDYSLMIVGGVTTLGILAGLINWLTKLGVLQKIMDL